MTKSAMRTELSLQEIADGLTAAIRDPEVPVQYSPLLMAARKRLNENEIGRLQGALADANAGNVKLLERIDALNLENFTLSERVRDLEFRERATAALTDDKEKNHD